MRSKHNGTTRVHTCIDIELNFTRRNSTTKNKIRSYLIQYRSQFLRKFRKKKDRVIVERITIRVKVSTRTEILHCPNSLQFPYRRFRCRCVSQGVTASWHLGKKKIPWNEKEKKKEREKKKRRKSKKKKKKIKKRAVERRIYFHGV